MKRTTEALKYIDEQLKKMRQSLRESEDEFNRFTQDNQLVSIDLQSETLLIRAQNIQDEIRKVREDKRELEDTLQRLNQFIKNPTASGHKFYSKKADEEYQSTNSALVGFLLKRDTLLEDYTPQHPQVVAIGRKIIEVARKMAILLQLQISNKEKNDIDLQTQLENVDRKTQVLMEKKLEFDRLKRKVGLHNDMTALLEKKNQEILIRKAEKPEEVTIVKPALLSTKPVNPPKTAATGAMGCMVGIVLGLLIAFIMETFDTSLGAIEDVEEALGTQVLGVIPHADDRDIQEILREKYPEGIQGPSEKQSRYLISHFVPKSMMAENFRALRTNIQFKDTDKQIRTIAITSTSPQEGKTIVTINLAITLAQAGMRTLLVGSDLRKPMLAKVFGVEASPGLTDILMGNYPWRDTVKSVTDLILGKMTLDAVTMTPGMDNLHIITSGPIPPNPAELIDSSRLMDFLEEAKEEYDLILFDSTPILSATDAAILGTKVDGVLLVYRVGTVSRGLLKRSSTQLEQINCHIMGVVLNGMRPEVSPDFHDYGYYKYYYAYGEERRDKRGLGYRKGSSFSWKKGDGQSKPEGEVLPPSVGEAAQEKQGKRLSLLRLSLMGVALVALALGILWHNGVVDLSRLLKMEPSITADETRSSVKKRPSSKPISSSPPLAKAWAEMDTPASPLGISTYPTEKSRLEAETLVRLAKKRPSKRAVQRKPRPLPAGLRSTVSRKEPKLHPKTPIFPSPGLAEVWAKIDTPPSPLEILSYSTEQSMLEAQTTVRLVREKPAKKGIERKPGDIATTPKRIVSMKKVRLKREAPILRASVSTKDWAENDTPASLLKIQSYPYSLYLGSFRNRERTQKAISIYSKKGLSPYWVKMDFKEKGVWFRVYAGHFKTQQHADRFRQKRQLKEAEAKNTRYANLIGIYSEGAVELKNQIRVMRGLGYSPYVIEDRGKKSRLFVGGFLRKHRALVLHRDLKSKGIQSHVVMR
jgi:capsular exopolysaccharide synthesis family protein